MDMCTSHDVYDERRPRALVTLRVGAAVRPAAYNMPFRTFYDAKSLLASPLAEAAESDAQRRYMSYEVLLVGCPSLQPSEMAVNSIERRRLA